MNIMLDTGYPMIIKTSKCYVRYRVPHNCKSSKHHERITKRISLKQNYRHKLQIIKISRWIQKNAKNRSIQNIRKNMLLKKQLYKKDTLYKRLMGLLNYPKMPELLLIYHFYDGSFFSSVPTIQFLPCQ